MNKLSLPLNELRPLAKFVKTDATPYVSWGVIHSRGLQSVQNTSLKYNLTGKGIKVAVLDTGFNTKHENLKVERYKNFTNSENDIEDLVGHGSHCAGIICSQGVNNIVTGITTETSLYIAKVLGDNGCGTVEWIVAGIEWAIEQGVDIISMSLGSNSSISPIFSRVIEKAIKAGIIICVAAGNSGPYPETVEMPGNYSLCITVGAVKNNNSIAVFSSRGDCVDVVAPGINILSCYSGDESSYAYLSGTSMATPFVAGVCALILEYSRREYPTLQLNQAKIEKILKDCALDLGPKGFDIHYGSGLVNLECALRKITALAVIDGPKIE